MAPRLKLQDLLKTLGTTNVYFQPPENISMKYPAIVYTLDYQAAQHANNKPYSIENRYQVTVIDRDPDSLIPGRVASLPKCTFARAFKQNDLNHTIYALYF